MNDVFGNIYSSYYDLLYHDKDYETEIGFVYNLLNKYVLPYETELLELGCGTGKHAQGLARIGYKVHGVDISPAMIEFANSQKSVELSERITYEVADVRSIQLARKFDAVISLFHVISYQHTNTDLSKTFKSVAEHLKPGGIFLFDCWYGPAVLTDKPVVRVKRINNDKIEVIRIAQPVMYPNMNVVDVNYTILVKILDNEQIKEFRETHRMRYLFTPEIDLLLNESGLKRIGSTEWMTNKAPGFDSWGVVFMAKKE